MSAGSRERMRQLRRDRRALGLIEISVWVPRERVDELRQTASFWCSIAVESDPTIKALREEQDALRREAAAQQAAEEKYDAHLRKIAGMRPEVPPERRPKSEEERRAFALSEARKVYEQALAEWQARNSPYAVQVAIRTASDFLVARYNWPYAEADIEAELFAYSAEEVFGTPD